MCGASGAARLPWLVDVIEDFFGCSHKEDPELGCKIRRTLETTAAAAIGAARYCHGERYVDALREPEALVLYAEEELKVRGCSAAICSGSTHSGMVQPAAFLGL